MTTRTLKDLREWAGNRADMSAGRGKPEVFEAWREIVDRLDALLAVSSEPEIESDLISPPSRLQRAVDNVYMLARREVRRIERSTDVAPVLALTLERWQHVLRICEEAGGGSAGILRRSLPTELTDGEKPTPTLMYSACRICGRGTENRTGHDGIALYGVHTDANGKPNQPNKGTAYCDRCEDETLVIRPAVVPAVETLLIEADEYSRGSLPGRNLVGELAAALRTLSASHATTEAEAFKAGWAVAYEGIAEQDTDFDAPGFQQALAAYREQKGRGK